jgi:hypothetical protein
MYDPTIGRWTSQDPIGFEAGDANLYRYVGNGPTDGTDPSGLRVIATISEYVFGIQGVGTIQAAQLSDYIGKNALISMVGSIKVPKDDLNKAGYQVLKIFGVYRKGGWDGTTVSGGAGSTINGRPVLPRYGVWVAGRWQTSPFKPGDPDEQFNMSVAMLVSAGQYQIRGYVVAVPRTDTNSMVVLNGMANQSGARPMAMCEARLMKYVVATLNYEFAVAAPAGKPPAKPIN